MPDSGEFYRIESHYEKNNGLTKGSNEGRYLNIWYEGKQWKAHQLAFHMMDKAVPKYLHIDHIDGDKANNKFSNLRVVTHRENLANSPRSRTGRLAGTRRNGKKWTAQINIRGKSKYLGTFSSEKEAHQAYLAAARTL